MWRQLICLPKTHAYVSSLCFAFCWYNILVFRGLKMSSDSEASGLSDMNESNELVKNSFTRRWVPFRDFRPFSSPFLEVSKIRPLICILVKLDLFRCPARDRKSPLQRRNVPNITLCTDVPSSLRKEEGTSVHRLPKYFRQRSWFGEKFVPQTVYLSLEVNKYTAESFRLGRRATLYCEGLININRNLHKAVDKNEDFKRRDRRCSFSISLVFIRQFWNWVCKRDSCSTYRNYYN